MGKLCVLLGEDGQVARVTVLEKRRIQGTRPPQRAYYHGTQLIWPEGGFPMTIDFEGITYKFDATAATDYGKTGAWRYVKRIPHATERAESSSSTIVN